MICDVCGKSVCRFIIIEGLLNHMFICEECWMKVKQLKPVPYEDV